MTLKQKGQLLKTQILIVEKSVQPILGPSTCENFIWSVCSYITDETDETSFMGEYKYVFEGQGETSFAHVQKSSISFARKTQRGFSPHGEAEGNKEI